MFCVLAVTAITIAAPVPKEAERKGVQLTIVSIESTVLVDDLVSFQIRVSNHTDKDVSIDRGPGTTDVLPVFFEIRGPGDEQFEPITSSLANVFAFRNAQGILDSQSPFHRLKAGGSFICYDSLMTLVKKGKRKPVFWTVGKYRVRATMKTSSGVLTSNTLEIEVQESPLKFQIAVSDLTSKIADAAVMFQWFDEPNDLLSKLREKERDFAGSNVLRLMDRATLLEDVASAKTTKERRAVIDKYMSANKERPEVELIQTRVRLLSRLIRLRDAELAAELAKQVEESVLGVEELKKSAAALQPKK